ncbi:MAG TPA: hypothetical protein PKD51_11535 [Saprospiraceae bacterium]|nr:hypothetical protein [Saprospiraceae bacterium]
MANIRFNLAADRSGKTKYITLIYDYLPGKRIKMSTKIKCTPEQWCKQSHRVLPHHPQCDYINAIIIKIINQCNDVKLLYLSKGTNATGVAYRNAITKIIAPDAHQPHDEGKTYSASRYWSRFYDILGDYKTNKAAYEAVESEWNEVGVEMFPTYEAFRAGKTRYMTQKKHINRAKAVK